MKEVKPFSLPESFSVSLGTLPPMENTFFRPKNNCILINLWLLTAFKNSFGLHVMQ